MPAIKLNISLDERVAATMRRRASELGAPASRYLSDLIMADDRTRREELAEEGYRILAEETRRFVEDTSGTTLEGWPVWEEADAPST